MLRRLTLLAAALLAGLLAVPTANAATTREVMFVGNNWDGTADVVDMNTYAKLAHINVVPDLKERQAEILADPMRAGLFLGIRLLIGEGHDQLVDDMFSSKDGRMVYVSRPSLADVVGIDLKTQKIAWRIPVDGSRADHMALSPDGTRLLVSASTANKVHVIDPIAGKLVGEFPSGDSPHESNFSRDGRLIYHASIGLVYTPLDHPALDTSKGERIFEIVDAKTLQVIKRFDIGKVLEANGYPGYSSAIRPMAIAPDERHFYFQLSFLHGFVEFDMQTGKPLRIATLPISDAAKKLSHEEYLLDSAHHGLAIDGSGKTLCVAGTMSDYAALVDRATFSLTRFDIGKKPYWATDSADGKRCWVSFSGDDKVDVLDYSTKKVVASVPVGDHPQRVRSGVIATDIVGDLPPAAGRTPTVARSCLRGGRARFTVRDPDGLVARVEFRARGKRIALDRRAPFRLTLARRDRARLRGAKVSAIVHRGDGGRRTITRALPRCGTTRR